ncbi:Rib/alpha-like domain-containing protein [Limosilactobacillus caecicola]|uniref:Rib/alpha-like domain-containing protein n=1 Tax=Limosilactobacillus caecicola TaxID=2941332 RepID=UPI0020413A0C|nr:Rib/alpha-like domain-containing protein [Limosilactobacillus caecicola]
MNQAKTALDNANTDVTAKQTAVNNAQAALNQASQPTKGSITDPASWGLTITATDAAKNAAAQWRNGDHSASLKSTMEKGLTITYTPTGSDNSTTLTTSDVMYAIHNVLDSLHTNSQLNIEVHEFVAALVNGIHQALGMTNEVIPNQAVMNDAYTYAQNPKTKTTSWGGTIPDISDLSEKTTPTTAETTVTFGYGNENGDYFSTNGFSFSGTAGHKLNLGNFKTLFANILLEHASGTSTATTWNSQNIDLLTDSDFILGTTTAAKTYFGFAFANSNGEQGGRFYLLTNNNTNDATINNSTSYGLSNQSTDTTALQQALTNAKSALETAQTAQTTAQSNYNSAKNVADAANEILATANQKLANAKQSLTDAQNALANAKSSQTQANTAVTEAQNAYDQAHQAYLDAQQDVATKQQKLQDAKNQLAKDQQALEAAQADVTTKQTALDQAQTALKSANDDLTSAKQAASDAAEKLNNLENAQELLKKAQDNLTAAQDQLKTAQELVQTAQNKLDADTPSLEQAKNDAKTANDNLATAQTNYNKAKAAYDQAVSELITDAEQYGDVVKTHDLTMTAGTAVPSPVLDNPMTAHRENNEVTAMFMNLAAISGDTIPEGTTITWSNPAQVNHDSQTAGDYQENVLITFPDGSTVTKTITLHVKANPALHQSSNSNNGLHINAQGQVVNAQGQIVPGYTVINGQIVKTNSTTPSTTANTTTAPITSRKQLNNGQLPQTGNHSITGAIALGVSGMLSAIGLTAVNKKKSRN